MRIEQVNIFGFGKWTDQQFKLDPHFQVFYGENEAGKSTLSAFIDGILFGFATKKQPYAQYIPKSGHSYGGELTLVQAQQRYLVKRVAGTAGGTVTVTTADGTQHDEKFLQDLLAPIDKTLFRQIFRFDQQDLMTIFQLRKSELERHLLTVGAAGSHDWLTLAQKYRREATRLYKPRGRVWPLNQAFTKLKDLNAKLTAAQATLPAYLAKQEKATRQKAMVATLTTKVTAVREQLTTLARLQAAWPNYQTLQALAQELAQQPTALATDLYQNYQQLQQQRQSKAAELQQLSAKLNAATDGQELAPALLFYQQYQAEFERQLAKAAQVQASTQEKQQLQQQQQALVQESQQLQQTLQVTTPLAPLSELDLEQAQANHKQRQALQQQQMQLQEDQQRQNQQIQQLTQAVTALEERLQQPTTRTQHQQQPAHYLVWGLVAIIGLLLPSWGKLVALVGAGGLVWQFFNHQSAEQPAPLQQQWQQALAKLDQQQEKAAQLKQQLTAVQGSLAAQNAAWETLKARYGYQDLATDTILNHQHDFKRLLACQQQIKQLKQRQDEIQERLAQWTAGFKFAQAWLPLADATPMQVLQRAKDFVKTQAAKLTTLRDQNQNYAYYQQQATQVQQQLAQLDQQQHQLLADHQLVSEHELEKHQQADQKRRQLQEHWQVLQNQLQPFLPALKQYADETALQTTVATCKQTLQQQQRQLTAAQQQLTKLQTQLAQLASDGSYRVLRQQVAQQQTEIIQLAQKWLTYQLTAQWIETTLTQASQRRLPQMLAAAQRNFAALTQQRYVKIILTAKTIKVVRFDQQQFAVGELSQGTAEQLYVALRLAFAQTISDVQKMPLVIDDGFVNFDQQRQQQVLNLLAELSQTTQVIYFTAHPVKMTVGQQTDLTSVKK